MPGASPAYNGSVRIGPVNIEAIGPDSAKVVIYSASIDKVLAIMELFSAKGDE